MPAAAPPAAAAKPDSIEACLRQGLVRRAQDLGWWGQERAYLLVRDGSPYNFHVTLQKKRPDADLGFDLSDELGIAVIKKVWPSSVAGVNGQLREGDVLRGVDGEALWTCEAVVKAIRMGMTVTKAATMKAQEFREAAAHLRAVIRRRQVKRQVSRTIGPATRGTGSVTISRHGSGSN